MNNNVHDYTVKIVGIKTNQASHIGETEALAISEEGIKRYKDDYFDEIHTFDNVDSISQLKFEIDKLNNKLNDKRTYEIILAYVYNKNNELEFIQTKEKLYSLPYVNSLINTISKENLKMEKECHKDYQISEIRMKEMQEKQTAKYSIEKLSTNKKIGAKKMMMSIVIGAGAILSLIIKKNAFIESSVQSIYLKQFINSLLYYSPSAILTLLASYLYMDGKTTYYNAKDEIKENEKKL